MMRQDRFTEGAQEVLAASQEMVRKERHSQWDVEHVLIAMADEREGEAARILRQAGIDKERIYQALQEVRGESRVDSPTAESKYKALEKYSVDLTEAARQGKLDPVIGREDEIKR